MTREPRIYDISVTLNRDTPEWPGDTAFSFDWGATISSGASVNVSAMTSSPHVGTHADAPLHVHDGWPGSHELPLDAFFGRAIVVDVSEVDGAISLDMLSERIPGDLAERLGRAQRVLLKTGSGIAAGHFPGEWPTLSEECARSLLGHGLRLLGVDCPSVDARESKNLPVHHMLFSGNACILENLDLRRVSPGEYELLAFPLKLMGMDAAPVRAVLREL
ncbi:MAG TPA: cyclase family protein [Gemmatimonadaceae bacterium]|nr:cyclase family protein [Gemmatimonadaceae bacterium]